MTVNFCLQATSLCSSAINLIVGFLNENCRIKRPCNFLEFLLVYQAMNHWLLVLDYFKHVLRYCDGVQGWSKLFSDMSSSVKTAVAVSDKGRVEISLEAWVCPTLCFLPYKSLRFHPRAIGVSKFGLLCKYVFSYAVKGGCLQ